MDLFEPAWKHGTGPFMHRHLSWTNKDKREAVYNSCPRRWQIKIDTDPTFDLWSATDEELMDFLTALYKTDEGNGTLARIKVQRAQEERNAAAQKRAKQDEKDKKARHKFAPKSYPRDGRDGYYQQPRDQRPAPYKSGGNYQQRPYRPAPPTKHNDRGQGPPNRGPFNPRDRQAPQGNKRVQYKPGNNKSTGAYVNDEYDHENEDYRGHDDRDYDDRRDYEEEHDDRRSPSSDRRDDRDRHENYAVDDYDRWNRHRDERHSDRRRDDHSYRPSRNHKKEAPRRRNRRDDSPEADRPRKAPRRDRRYDYDRDAYDLFN